MTRDMTVLHHATHPATVLALLMLLSGSCAKAGGHRLSTSDYSARFQAGRFEYYSRTAFEPDMVYTLSAVKLGDERVEFTSAPTVKAADDAVCYYYGDILSESYTSLPKGIAQCWVIDRRPRSPGDITIEATMRSPHQVTSSLSGLEFLSKHGRRVLSYGAVTVIDSRGRTCGSMPEVHDGTLTITIPGDYLETAEFPILVDPVVGPEAPVCPSFGPAPMNQENVKIAASPYGYLAVWQDNRGTRGIDIFGCRISPTGEVLDLMSIAVSAVDGDQVDPAVAWNGREYLVVWSDARDSKRHIYGARVTPGGEVIEKQGILLSGTTGTQTYPRVASDGSGWLVVWQDIRSTSPDIYGCKVSAEAVPSKTYGISTRQDNEETPDVTWNGSYFLVVWRDYRGIATVDTDIYGCRVAKNGIRLAGDIIISCNSTGLAGTPGTQRSPRVCAMGTSYVVVWEDCRNGANSDVYGARIASNGAVVDKGGLLISAAEGDQELPSVSYGGSRLLAVWRNRSNRAITGARIETNGTVLDPGGISISAAMAGSHGATVVGRDGKFMVAWNTLDAIDANVATTAVLENGSVANPLGVVISLGLDNQLDYCAAFNGVEYAIVWSQLVNGTYDILGARLSTAGELITPTPVNLTQAFVGDQTQPAIAWNGSQYLIVWSGTETYAVSQRDIRGLRFTSSLSPIDTSAINIGAANQDQILPCVASNGSGFLVAWEDSRNAISPNYYTDIYGAIVSASGVVTPTSPAINQSTGNQRRPRAASNGSGYLVVWEDYRAGNPKTYAARVTNTGSNQDASGITLPATSTYQTLPEVCYGGGNYLVTWSDWYTITGCRVSAAGAKLDAAGITIDTGSKMKLAPHACWDGSRFQVVWEDYRSSYYGNADIYHTTVGADGAVSASPRTPLVSDLIPQLAPRVMSGGGGGMLLYSRYDNYTNGVCAAYLVEEQVREVDTLAEAKGLPTGTPLALRGKVVTGAFPGYFYMQEPDRTNGIKVLSSVPVSTGDVVDVVGSVSISDGERLIQAGMLSAMGVASEDPKPLGMRGEWLGGGPLNGQTPGITGAIGVNNIGLLVTTWGKVTSAASGYFNIEVRPGVTVKVKSMALTRPTVGKIVSVTGISTCEVVSGSTVRAILPRQQSDIVILK